MVPCMKRPMAEPVAFSLGLSRATRQEQKWLAVNTIKSVLSRVGRRSVHTGIGAFELMFPAGLPTQFLSG